MPPTASRYPPAPASSCSSSVPVAIVEAKALRLDTVVGVPQPPGIAAQFVICSGRRLRSGTRRRCSSLNEPAGNPVPPLAPLPPLPPLAPAPPLPPLAPAPPLPPLLPEPPLLVFAAGPLR